ncbi:MAG TPA: DUF308 domain-containing protein [Candidatus Paceibacterota bacterium]|nr:DUF308 domain-containing protein [Candidatus Pacearchaeota archaeon]HRR95013.1 DUF308 domain-containing protein [Candidatus Paceibacterota bacterium]
MENKNQDQNFTLNIIDNYVKEISSNWVSIFLNAFLMIIFGVIFLAWPQKAVIFMAYLIGLMAILGGILMLSLSFKVKSIEKKYQKIKEELKSKIND